MKESLKSIQPDLDRLGAIAKLYYPECKIVRLRDRIILEKNAFISVQFIMEEGDLRLFDPHSASKGVWSFLGVLLLLKIVFAPKEMSILYIVLGVIGLLFWIIQPRDNQWKDKALDRVYRAYISDDLFEPDTTEFRDSYSTVYKYGTKMRAIALFNILIWALFIECLLLIGDHKIIILYGSIPFICILICSWIYFKKTDIEYDESDQSIELA